MVVFRLIGWAFLFFGFLILSSDLLAAIGGSGGFHPNKLVDLWNMLSPGGADEFQGVIVAKLGHAIWVPFGVVLNTWAFMLLLIPGFLLEMIGRPKVDKPHKRAPRVPRPSR